MKQSNKNRQNGRHANNRFGNNRHSGNSAITRNTAFDSSSVAGRVRGTSQQLIDKYLSLAKDAKAQDDRVLYETYLQYADHYARMLDLAIQNEQARVQAMQQQQAQRTANSQSPEEKGEETPMTDDATDTDDKKETQEVKKPTHNKVKIKKVQPENTNEVTEQLNTVSLPVTDSLPLASEELPEKEPQSVLQPVVIEIPE